MDFIPINETVLTNIKITQLSLEEFYILAIKYYSKQWTDFYKSNDLFYTKLRNKKLLNASNEITEEGKKALLFILGVGEDPLADKVEPLFEEFWKTYPSSDKWGIFKPSRNLKTNKRSSRQLFISLLREGVDFNLIMRGLVREIEFRKKSSSPNKNNLTFMQNPETWLRNRGYEVWLEETTSENNLVGKDLI